MADYISRQAAIDALGDEPEVWHEDDLWDMGVHSQFKWDRDAIEAIPPADVRPVVRGRWELDSDPGEPWKYRCNLCGEVTTSTCMGEPRYHYCPMCGADMMEVKL